MARLVLLFFFAFGALTTSAQGVKPVFVKTTCDGKISSPMISSLKDEIRNSQKYQLAHNLAADGQREIVLTINLKCTDRDNIAAIATVFGAAKCFSAKNCHLTIDGSSLRSDLCTSDPGGCGRALFKAFDDYANNPLAPPLKLN